MDLYARAEELGIQWGIEIETAELSWSALSHAIAAGIRDAGYVVYNRTDSRIQFHPVDEFYNVRTFKIVNDSSIRARNGLTGEVVSPILDIADIPLVTAIVKRLKRAGAEANDSCGIHIHFSSPYLTPAKLVNLVRMTRKYEDFIYKSLRIKYDREYRYTKRVLDSVIDNIGRYDAQRITRNQLATAWAGEYYSPSRYHSSRYHGVNLNAFFLRDAVELRWFNGTVGPKTATSQIRFALGMIVKAIDTNNTSARKKELTDTPKDLRDWRVFLNSLKLTGEENKFARNYLTRPFRISQ